jgi:hypothetical protein
MRASCRLGLAASLGLAACSGPIFQKARPSVERINPNVSADRFHIIAAIAGGDARTDLRISVTVRQELQDSGFNVVKKPGRWDSQVEAVHSICASQEAPIVDGVLFIWYNRLDLRDCASGNSAYEIQAGTEEGYTGMTRHLMAYLRKGQAAQSPNP